MPGERIRECDSFGSLQQVIDANPAADLILLDLHMPGAQGFSALIYLRSEYPAIPVAVVSAQDRPDVMRRAIDFGASAFIPKSTSVKTIGEALSAVLKGTVWVPANFSEGLSESEEEEKELAQRISSLTRQQFRVLMMLADGALNKQIASELNISEGTTKTHVTAILRKLRLRRRTQAAVLAQRLLQAENIRVPTLDEEQQAES